MNSNPNPDPIKKPAAKPDPAPQENLIDMVRLFRKQSSVRSGIQQTRSQIEAKTAKNGALPGPTALPLLKQTHTVKKKVISEKTARLIALAIKDLLKS